MVSGERLAERAETSDERLAAAAIEGCGCGRRKPIPSEAESVEEDGDDHASVIAPFGDLDEPPFGVPDEPIAVPFAWEDVRDALEAARDDDG